MPLRPIACAALTILLGIAALTRPAGASEDRIESLCHPWTTARCVLRVAGTLRSARSGLPLRGKTLRFVAGRTVICASTTDRSGRASCSGVVPSGRVVAESGYRIEFDGDERFIAGSAEGRAAARSHVADSL